MDTKTHVRRLIKGDALREWRYRVEERTLTSRGDYLSNDRVKAVLSWLLRAQGMAGDDGVAQGYHAGNRRWGASYPETTGYIICSIIHAVDAGFDDEGTLLPAAERMGHWLVATQMESGAFPGGTVAERVRRPAVFNTGQIVKGMSVLLDRRLDSRRAIADSARRAAEYMKNTLDEDGCWRQGISHLTTAPVHSYNVLAAWGLARYGMVARDESSVSAACRNARWVCTQQESDAWFRHMAFNTNDPPLTHTIAYTIQGLMEIGALVGNQEFIERSISAAERVFAFQDAETGALPGQFRERWTPFRQFTSMTGNAQMAVIAHRIASLTGDQKWREKAIRANAICKRFQEVGHANPGRRGAVRGAFPSNGNYGSYWYMNWTQKFFLDALLSELGVEIA